MEAEEMKNLLKVIVESLVDHPEHIQINEVEGQHACVLELTVHRDDIGKIIGKRGVHAQAIRTIITAAGGKKKKRYVFEIIEGD